MNLTKNEICEIVMGFESEKIYQLNATYCEIMDYCDDHIYEMDLFNDIMQGREPLEIVNSVNNDFNINHEYFYFDGYGNISSKNYLDYNDLPEFCINVAETILENWEEFEYLF